jgi:hypothetical protein
MDPLDRGTMGGNLGTSWDVLASSTEVRRVYSWESGHRAVGATPVGLGRYRTSWPTCGGRSGRQGRAVRPCRRQPQRGDLDGRETDATICPSPEANPLDQVDRNPGQQGRRFAESRALGERGDPHPRGEFLRTSSQASEPGCRRLDFTTLVLACGRSGAVFCSARGSR